MLGADRYDKCPMMIKRKKKNMRPKNGDQEVCGRFVLDLAIPLSLLFVCYCSRVFVVLLCLM